MKEMNKNIAFIEKVRKSMKGLFLYDIVNIKKEASKPHKS